MDKARPAPKLLPGAYLYGDVGTGKTLAACGAIRAYAERHIVTVEGIDVYSGKRAKFVNTCEWFELLRSTFGSRSATEAELFNSYSKCGLLVLDDLGKGKQSEWTAEKLYMLLNKRWENELPTIITSNHPLAELIQILAGEPQMMEAMASRIVAMCKPYFFDGPDRRIGEK